MAIKDAFEILADYDIEKYAEKKKKLDPKAKSRNRGDVVVPAERAKDHKDHYPINSSSQARNALSRVNQHSSAPSWYNGSLQSLINAVYRKVHSKYPSIKIDKSKKKPGKQAADELDFLMKEASHHDPLVSVETLTAEAPEKIKKMEGKSSKERDNMNDNFKKALDLYSTLVKNAEDDDFPSIEENMPSEIIPEIEETEIDDTFTKIVTVKITSNSKEELDKSYEELKTMVLGLSNTEIMEEEEEEEEEEEDMAPWDSKMKYRGETPGVFYDTNPITDEDLKRMEREDIEAEEAEESLSTKASYFSDAIKLYASLKHNQ